MSIALDDARINRRNRVAGGSSSVENSTLTSRHRDVASGRGPTRSNDDLGDGDGDAVASSEVGQRPDVRGVNHVRCLVDLHLRGQDLQIRRYRGDERLCFKDEFVISRTHLESGSPQWLIAKRRMLIPRP